MKRLGRVLFGVILVLSLLMMGASSVEASDQEWLGTAIKDLNVIMEDNDMLSYYANNYDIEGLCGYGAVSERHARAAYNRSCKIIVSDPDLKNAKMNWEKCLQFVMKAGNCLTNRNLDDATTYIESATVYMERMGNCVGRYNIRHGK